MAERFCRRQAAATTTKRLNSELAFVSLHEEVSFVHFAVPSPVRHSVPICDSLFLLLCCDGGEQQQANKELGNEKHHFLIACKERDSFELELTSSSILLYIYISLPSKYHYILVRLVS